ncbi:MAG: PilX N-terminal domain-containing pilus assembly protein [Pseudomonadota bacterium]
MTRSFPRRSRERGITLIIALVMLVMLTLLALTSFNLGKANMQIVSNMQQRDEAIGAADAALEEVISSTRFFTSPEDAIPTPCNGAANTRCIDTNGDGVPDVTVKLTPKPACVKAQAIKNSALDLTKADDVGCAVGSNQSFGVAGAVTGNSLCADSVWDVHAVATDVVTQAKVEVTKGISVRVANDDVATSCP